jgi:hypothetical protein
MRTDSAHVQQKEHAHAHKFKLDAEKGHSEAKIKVGCRKSSKKERRAVARQAVATKKSRTPAAGAAVTSP